MCIERFIEIASTRGAIRSDAMDEIRALQQSLHAAVDPSDPNTPTPEDYTGITEEEIQEQDTWRCESKRRTHGVVSPKEGQVSL